MKLKLLSAFLIGILGFSTAWAAIPSKGGATTNDCNVEDCTGTPIPKKPN